MSSNLRVITYNCQSFNSKKVILDSLLNSCDLLCLQETFINDENSLNLDTLDESFISSYVPAWRNSEFSRGRCCGGLAIFWRKSYNVNIFPIQFSNRIMGVKLIINNVTYIVLNVYFCCDYGNSDSLIEFQSILADLSDTICSEVYDDIIIVGDFNADPLKGRFYPRLKSILDDLNLQTNDVISLPAASYTYISPNSVSGTSWLDHVVVSRGDLTVNHKILYGMVFYDHLPMYFEMNLPIPVCFAEGLNFSRSPQLNISWDKVSESMKKDYCLSLDKLSLAIWDEVLICNKSLCKNNGHKKSLDFLFETILEII